jgi:predicted nuclease of predicted toxin-antitoxin system
LTTSAPAWLLLPTENDVLSPSLSRETPLRLLFDQNLSPRLVQAIADLFPGSAHVRDIGLATADDDDVWSYAATHDFAIVSKDADFHQRSFLFGHPPKVIWVRLGNCSTADVIALLRMRARDILAFDSDPGGSFLELR